MAGKGNPKFQSNPSNQVCTNLWNTTESCGKKCSMWWRPYFSAAGEWRRFGMWRQFLWSVGARPLGWRTQLSQDDGECKETDGSGLESEWCCTHSVEMLTNTPPWLFKSAQENDHVAICCYSKWDVPSWSKSQGLTYICRSCGVKHLSYFHQWKKWSNLTWVETNHLVGQSLGGGAPMSTKLIRCSKLTAPATTVSAGFKHSAAVCNEDVYLWGANNQGLRWVFRKNLDLIYHPAMIVVGKISFKDVFPIEHAKNSITLLCWDIINGSELFQTLACILTAFPNCSCILSFYPFWEVNWAWVDVKHLSMCHKF